LVERMSSLPGVTSAAAVDPLPFAHSNRGGSFKIVGRDWDPSKPKPDVAYRRASAGYFKTMRIPVLRGREFSNRDEFGAPKVAVVDEPFVKQFFPNEEPIGKQLAEGFGGSGADPFTIVGVVGGTKSQHMTDAPQPTIYYCGAQAPLSAISVAFRVQSGDPLRLVSAARQIVASLDHDLPIYRPATMEERLEDSLSRTRFSTTLLSVFAGIALLLAAFGIYGVISYIVGQRSHEIGVRMALGARPRDAVALVLRQAMVPLAAGIAAGLIASLAATRSLSSLLYGVTAFDPLTYAAVSLFLAAVALLASYVPALRATKVDPMVALRYE